MALERFSNNFSTTLGAAATNTATTLTLTTTAGLTATTTAPATQTRLLNTRTGEIVVVTNVVNATDVTVTRAAEGTAAAAMNAGDTVVQSVTRGGLYNNDHPGGLVTTLPTGSPTFTPTLTVKYHYIFLPTTALTAWTIAAPTLGVEDLEIGAELRLWIKQPSTGNTTVQPTWSATYDRTISGGTSLRGVATTASSVTSFSFAYSGGGISATNAWRLIA